MKSLYPLAGFQITGADGDTDVQDLTANTAAKIDFSAAVTTQGTLTTPNYDPNYFTVSDTADTITVNKTGLYLALVNAVLDLQGDHRYQVQVHVNDTQVGPVWACSPGAAIPDQPCSLQFPLLLDEGDVVNFEYEADNNAGDIGCHEGFFGLICLGR